MIDFLKQLTDPQSIIHYGGLWLLLFVVFAETGLLVGFFLLSDSTFSSIRCALAVNLSSMASARVSVPLSVSV